ncbi:MAG: hypothetical protein K2K27_00445 [Muribaculaceae bacterium]|nr:hypothetical protein [Muribaculaceae bacterium]MDE6642555.1 hypothetical protein [Muribaculaceae bacterium]
MNNPNDILTKIGRNDGMTVPKGYFEDFISSMQQSLPEIEQPKPEKGNPVWLKIRPYVYLAAMFAGIFCMMKMFDMIKSSSTDLNIDNYPALTATLEESGYDLLYQVDDRDIIEDFFNDGISVDDIEDNDSLIETSFSE